MADREPTYRELLQHPMWQRKRLQMLERADFRCEECGSDERQLHVHHRSYARGRKPWEYPDENFEVLCVECHRSAQNILDLLKAEIGKLKQESQEELLGYAVGLRAYGQPDDEPIEIFSTLFGWGLARAWRIKPSELEAGTEDGRITVLKLLEIRDGPEEFQRYLEGSGRLKPRT